MRKFSVIARLLALAILTYSSTSVASGPTLVEFGYGATHVDFTHDSIADLVVLGHRENFNAHSLDVASFYVLAGEKGKKQWNIIPVVEDGKEQFEVSVSGGADCILHDFRLLRGADKNTASLIIADRDLGTGFSDSRRVTFSHYSLRRNSARLLGFPLYSFELTSVSTSKAVYCDVGDAFRKELTLDHSRQRWQGYDK